MDRLFDNVTVVLPVLRPKEHQKQVVKNNGGTWAYRFLRSAGKHLGAKVVTCAKKIPSEPGVVIVWGTGRGGKETAKFCIQNQLPFIHLDRPYVRRDAQLRATYNPVGVTRMQTMITKVYDVSGDRWRSLAVPIHPWREPTAGPVILCCPGAVTAEIFAPDADNFKHQSAALLRENTRRKVVVRPKPLRLGWGDQTKEFIRYVDKHNPHAVVGFNSNTVVEAALHGVPVFVSKHSAAAPVGCLDFEKIEEPVMPERSAWANSLAYAQFSFKEIKDPQGKWLTTILRVQGGL